MSWPLLWIGLAIVLAIIEAATLGLTTIWFAAGALVSLIFAWLGFSLVTQIVVFFISGIAFLAITRPLVIKYFKVGSVKTNVDSLIGKSGVVIEAISEHEYGQVKIHGQIWTAKTNDHSLIEKDENIVVSGIEGVKLVVTKNHNL